MSQEKAAASAAGVETIELSDLEVLLKDNFKPKSDKAASAVQSAVVTLASQALANTALVSDDAIKSIESMITEIDRKISEQLNEVLHHADFQKIEGSWRGLQHLVFNTETDETLKIKVLNIQKKEFTKTFKKFSGAAWDQSPLFKQIYEHEFGTANGEPYGCLVGDYHFDHSSSDVDMLKGIGQIAAAAHAPFITGTAPSLLNMDTWEELDNPRDLTKIFQSPDYAAWRSFRDTEDSKYITMTMPRFMSRLPYGAKSSPVEEFAFEEDFNGGDHSKYTWSNACYAMARNIGRSFKLFGWCASIRGKENGGEIEALPCHTFEVGDGSVNMKCPTEVSITDRREAELSKNGMLPLIHWKNTDSAVFIGAQTLNKPKEFDDPDATANAALGARLPYLFSTCRFAHFLKHMVRNKLGSFAERSDMENWLNNWIMNYVISDDSASEEMKAQYPLREAQVEVREVEGAPGYYKAAFWLRPHYQLEGLTASLRLASTLPSQKEG